MKVCYHCGLMLMFVQNPALFRPKTGTETLPRPAGVPEPSKETLPRPANDEVNET
jgi:hypothetical protein